jgi:hypothetical protein
MEQKEWLEKYLEPLKGATITEVEIKTKNEVGYPEDWPVLTMKFNDGHVGEVEVSRDEEGNGPGFLFGLPMPEQ